MTIRLTLPVPPSLNNLYANNPKGGRFKTRDYRRWIKSANDHLMLQVRSWKGREIKGPAVVTIRVAKAMRGDVDNRAKAPVDLLVAAGITADDSKNHTVTVTRDDTLPLCQCVVTVEARS